MSNTDNNRPTFFAETIAEPSKDGGGFGIIITIWEDDQEVDRQYHQISEADYDELDRGGPLCADSFGCDGWELEATEQMAGYADRK